MNVAIGRATCLMIGADDAFAARATGHFVRSNDLAAAALALADALATQPSRAERRIGSGHPCMPGAYAAAAVCARSEARRTRLVPAFFADAFVRAAMHAMARPARARMLIAARCAVHMTSDASMLGTE